MILGLLLLAVGGTVTTSIAFLLEHRGATAAPMVEGRRPLRSAAGLLRSGWFALGLLLAALAWGLHVGALALALSVVQAVFAGGLVFLAVLAERPVGFRSSPASASSRSPRWPRISARSSVACWSFGRRSASMPWR